MTYEDAVIAWARRQGVTLPSGATDVGLKACAAGEHDQEQTFLTYLNPSGTVVQILFQRRFAAVILEVWEIGQQPSTAEESQ
jgi:hypothetical protein